VIEHLLSKCEAVQTPVLPKEKNNNNNNETTQTKGWGHGSSGRVLARMCEALGLSTGKKC
jgi:hypothetical protein